MGFVLMCAILWGLMALQVPIDRFGWLMLVGLGWFLGFLDGRRRGGRQDQAPLPPHARNTPGDDDALFADEPERPTRQP